MTGTGTWSQTPWPLPLVVEVYEWLSWDCSGTTRAMRNQRFDAVLLWRDRGSQEVPSGEQAAPKDHERVLWAVIGAVRADMEPTWPAFL